MATRTRNFNLGQTVITPNAQATLHLEDILNALGRHARCDWGDCCKRTGRRTNCRFEKAFASSRFTTTEPGRSSG